jgi:hypothetical protein
MKSLETTIEFIEAVVSRVYERPEVYCRTVGEADTLLHYFHLLWAVASDKRGEFDRVSGDEIEKLSGSPSKAFLSDADRVKFLENANDAIFQVVRRYWQVVDRGIGLTITTGQS